MSTSISVNSKQWISFCSWRLIPVNWCKQFVKNLKTIDETDGLFKNSPNFNYTLFLNLCTNARLNAHFINTLKCNDLNDQDAKRIQELWRIFIKEKSQTVRFWW